VWRWRLRPRRRPALHLKMRQHLLRAARRQLPPRCHLHLPLLLL